MKLMEEKGYSVSLLLALWSTPVNEKETSPCSNNINSMFDALFSFFFLIHENEGIGLKGYEQIENTFILARSVSESSVNKRMYIFYSTACFFAHSHGDAKGMK